MSNNKIIGAEEERMIESFKIAIRKLDVMVSMEMLKEANIKMAKEKLEDHIRMMEAGTTRNQAMLVIHLEQYCAPESPFRLQIESVIFRVFFSDIYTTAERDGDHSAWMK